MSTRRGHDSGGRRGARGRQRLRSTCVLVVAVLAIPLAPFARAASIDDFKAVLLLGFVQLSEWSQLSGNERDFRACVFDGDDFARRFQRAAKDEQVDQREIRVARVSTDDAPFACDLLFVPEAATETYREIATASENDALMLVVGERPEFARGLGAIHLYVEKDRLRFEIDRAAARRGGAKLSSRILRRAKLVK